MNQPLSRLKNMTKHAWEPRRHYYKGTATTGFKAVTKQEEAISPVIATILLIAITVAIIGGLYVLIGHFTSSTSAPLSATLQEQNEQTNTTTLILSYTTPSNMTDLANIGLTLATANSPPQYFSFSSVMNKTAGLTLTNVNNVSVTFKGVLSYANNSAKKSEFLVTFTNPHLNADNYIQSGAIITIQYLGSGAYNWSGVTFTLSYKGYSGDASVTLP